MQTYNDSLSICTTLKMEKLGILTILGTQYGLTSCNVMSEINCFSNTYYAIKAKFNLCKFLKNKIALTQISVAKLLNSAQILCAFIQ